jgi:hypothetical protein
MFDLNLPAFKASKNLVKLGSNVLDSKVTKWTKEFNADKPLEEVKLDIYQKSISRKCDKLKLDFLASAPTITDAQQALLDAWEMEPESK